MVRVLNAILPKLTVLQPPSLSTLSSRLSFAVINCQITTNPATSSALGIPHRQFHTTNRIKMPNIFLTRPDLSKETYAALSKE